MFDTSYPLPSSAVAVTLRADGQLQIYMPGQKSDGHTVTVPASSSGMKALVSILSHRERTIKPTISADMSSPTQGIVDEWLKTHAPTREAPTGSSTPARTKKQKGPSPAILANLDLSALVKK